MSLSTRVRGFPFHNAPLTGRQSVLDLFRGIRLLCARVIRRHSLFLGNGVGPYAIVVMPISENFDAFLVNSAAIPTCVAPLETRLPLLKQFFASCLIGSPTHSCHTNEYLHPNGHSRPHTSLHSVFQAGKEV